MASMTAMLLFPNIHHRLHPLSLPIHTSSSTFSSSRRRRATSISASSSSRSLEALIFDCDGVILESEHLHRQAYNDAFTHFNVVVPSSSHPLNWTPEFYDVLQNQIGGGKPKMRWYFKEHGWPSSTIFDKPPEDDSDRANLIDTLQDWKTERYKEIIKSGSVEPRPGVLRLMDEAKAAGKKLAVCSAATKSSVVLCLESLIGTNLLPYPRLKSKPAGSSIAHKTLCSKTVFFTQVPIIEELKLAGKVIKDVRFQSLDCFLAGDDVKEKKPDPSIYLTAVKRLGVSEKDCLVVEDSVIGLQAATGAGMSCVVTYTSSTAEQDFGDAIAIYPDLGAVGLKDLESLLENVVAVN